MCASGDDGKGKCKMKKSFNGFTAVKFCRYLELEFCFVRAYRRFISFPISRNLIKSLTLIGVLSFVLAISTNFIVQRNKKWELFEQNETFSHKGFVFYYRE